MENTVKIPDFIQAFYEEGKYHEIIFFMRRMWERHDHHTLKSHCNAVMRIKAKFTELTGNSPYNRLNSNAKYWDDKIAKYCSRLGVAALMDDMRQAVAKYQRINSIVYFLYTKGAACRWEMLLMDKIQADLADEKKRITAEMEEMAKRLGIAKMMRDKHMQPTWVGEARKRLAFLSKRQTSPEANREIDRIVHNLKSHGYPLTKNEETRS